MGEAVDHSFSQLTPDDLDAIVKYLRSVSGIASPGFPATAGAARAGVAPAWCRLA
jgi:hypothetical protein